MKRLCLVSTSNGCGSVCVLMMQVESGQSDSVASRGSLQSTEEMSAVSVSSRPADSNDVTSFSIRRPVNVMLSILSF